MEQPISFVWWRATADGQNRNVKFLFRQHRSQILCVTRNYFNGDTRVRFGKPGQYLGHAGLGILQAYADAHLPFDIRAVQFADSCIVRLHNTVCMRH